MMRNLMRSLKARFMNESFLLTTRTARRLYHDHAKGMPILDFHCHLPVRDIAENRSFRSLTEAWLGGDHYKWRAMRASGVPERMITGDASDREKFLAWAAVVPSTVGNPLYHWTHLELKRYFGVSGVLLNPGTATTVYDRCTSLLAEEGYSVRALLTRMNVRVVCTTDDPVDSLEHHARLRSDPSFPVTVVPTFRPDAAMAVEHPGGFNAWGERLSLAARQKIDGWTGFLAALRKRHDFFHEMGCRASDHGIEEPYSEECGDEEAERIFRSVRSGAVPSPSDCRAFKSALMRELARMDAEKGWVQQLHMGALRDVNSRFLRSMGPNSGFDTIGDFSLAQSLARFLDSLDREGCLPKTILYCLNPADNALLASMIGSFPEERVPGKMQFGSAWWFNDQQHGMEEQLRMLADMGLLARFVGMLTDSRSFLSFPRHEYFRRVLCAMLGAAVERGEMPADFDLMGGMVRNISWGNAAEYFGIPLKGASD
jgi:glucuronate isomerase